jgi:hypothetical protein
MFRITEDPSSGRLAQCWAKKYKNDSIVSVDMDVVRVRAAYCDPLCVCVVHSLGRYYFLYCQLGLLPPALADGSRPSWPEPEAVITAVPAPDDGCQHPKHVELPTEM